jgi:hypothetical protein
MYFAQKKTVCLDVVTAYRLKEKHYSYSSLFGSAVMENTLGKTSGRVEKTWGKKGQGRGPVKARRVLF